MQLISVTLQYALYLKRVTERPPARQPGSQAATQQGLISKSDLHKEQN